MSELTSICFSLVIYVYNEWARVDDSPHLAAEVTSAFLGIRVTSFFEHLLHNICHVIFWE